MNVTYEINPLLTAEDFVRVLRESTLAERRPVDDPERVRRMLAHADVTITAKAEGRIVGVARALTDYAYCAYLADLAVVTDWQRRGIGRELMRRLSEHLGEEVAIILLAAPAARSYYPHAGLTYMDSAWMIPRKR